MIIPSFIPHKGLNRYKGVDTQGCKPPWHSHLVTHSHLFVSVHMHRRVHVYTYVITYTHHYSYTFTHTHECFSLSPMSHSTIRTSCTVTHYGTPVGKYILYSNTLWHAEPTCLDHHLYTTGTFIGPLIDHLSRLEHLTRKSPSVS